MQKKRYFKITYYYPGKTQLRIKLSKFGIVDFFKAENNQWQLTSKKLVHRGFTSIKIKWCNVLKTYLKRLLKKKQR